MSARLDPKAPSMKLWHTLLARGVSEDEAAELMNGYAHELAEQQRAAAKAEFDRDIYIDELSMKFTGKVIDLIDPSAGPVRPGEEPTT